ncbi:hypothetical protein C8F01DRAFT_751334 [Mycena amicta]|nr:hypothetical protein C8F01DRAFT_751334 [Mycena amicta]
MTTSSNTRLKHFAAWLAAGVDTLGILSRNLQTPFLAAICATCSSLLKSVETIKQNRSDCARLLEQTHQLLYGIIASHIRCDSGELPPEMLDNLGKVTETLYKIHTFVQAQQESSLIKKLFRQSEINALLKDCYAGLQQAVNVFKVDSMGLVLDVAALEKFAQKAHQDVLDMIEAQSPTTDSDASSSRSLRPFSLATESSASISMLPSAPPIFHGRDNELSLILSLFASPSASDVAPRIAILGPGGIGKTSLARSMLHHHALSEKHSYPLEKRFFVPVDSANTKDELAAAIGTHVGIPSGRNMAPALVKHFAGIPKALLVLDNLETVWEPASTRGEVEQFLALLAGVKNLAIVITMRGAERPAQVQWSRPFLPPLAPLTDLAARNVFTDIADDVHDDADVDRILHLTDNMPLAISLLAHLVDVEGCTPILQRWETEKTALISDGYSQISNLDLSISLSLSSPRITSDPDCLRLLGLLALLPDGISDVELQQTKLPLANPLGVKTVLLRTSLAYLAENRRLKLLIPLREHLLAFHPPSHEIVQPLVRYFHELATLVRQNFGSAPISGMLSRVVANLANVQSLFLYVLKQKQPHLDSDVEQVIYAMMDVNHISMALDRGSVAGMLVVPELLPQPANYKLEVYYIIERVNSWRYTAVPDANALLERGLQYFEHFEDAKLKGRLLKVMTEYIMAHDNNMPRAAQIAKQNLEHCIATNLLGSRCDALHQLAYISWYTGAYADGIHYAQESRHVGQLMGMTFNEARALRLEGMCCESIGNYSASATALATAREMLALSGLEGTAMDHSVLNAQAQLHQLKTEYLAARKIHADILETLVREKQTSRHMYAVVSLADLDVQLAAPVAAVEKNLTIARSGFSLVGDQRGLRYCDMVLGDLRLREGEHQAAYELLIKCLGWSRGKESEMTMVCFERLADVDAWGGYTLLGTSWPTIYLAQALKGKRKLDTYKALQHLAAHAEDDDTALSLLTIALSGFTYMDVHQGRAQCMLCLGDISAKHGDGVQAKRWWSRAEGLFIRSSQKRKVAETRERLQRYQGPEVVVDPGASDSFKVLSKLAEREEPRAVAT